MTSGQEELGVQSATGSPGAWSAAIVVSHRIGLSAASPYVEELIRLRFEVVIYCLGDFEQTARSLWPNPTVRISGSDALSDPKWAALYRRAAESLSRLQPGLNPDQQPNWSHRSMPARRALRLTRWMLSRFDGCWRWLHEGSTTPWYPSMTIYRQQSPGEWATVIARVKDDLTAFVSTRHRCAPG